MMITTEKIIGPGGGLVQGPVAGGEITFFERSLFPIRPEAVIGTDIDTPPLPGKNFTPSLVRSPALSVEKKFRTLGLRA